MKDRRGAASTGRSAENGGSFKYQALEDSDDEIENPSQSFQPRGEEHPTILTLEHHLRSFRKTSSSRLALIVGGVLAVSLILFWAIA